MRGAPYAPPSGGQDPGDADEFPNHRREPRLVRTAHAGEGVGRRRADRRSAIDSDAHTYRFEITEPGRVRINLTSADGDPYLYLLAEDGSRVADDDEGGAILDARIERDLATGAYLIEATTYFERGLQPVSTNFNLVVHLVDEEAVQRRSNLKVEAIHTPDQVVAGEPFHVHYRAGNLGGGGLSDVGGGAVLYIVGPGDRAFTAPIWASEERWRAGVSYHSGPQTASATSTTLDEVAPFTLTLDRPGPSWVFVGAVAVDGLGREIGFHGIWRNLTVPSGVTFDPVTVSADGDNYEVSAAADTRGLVTVAVSSVAGPEAEVGRAQRAKAIYAAGVRARVLDGLFERPAITALRQQHEALPETEDATPVVVANPSSRALLGAFAEHHASAIATSGVAERVAAGGIVRAARAADLGWQDAAVRAMVADLAAGASCAGGATALIALDAELRAALPIHGLVDDNVLCGVAEADAATARFLRGLAIAGSGELRALVAPAPPASRAAPGRSRAPSRSRGAPSAGSVPDA